MTEVPGHAHYVTRTACVTRSKTVDKPPCYQTVPKHFWEILAVEHLKHEDKSNRDQLLISPYYINTKSLIQAMRFKQLISRPQGGGSHL